MCTLLWRLSVCPSLLKENPLILVCDVFDFFNSFKGTIIYNRFKLQALLYFYFYIYLLCSTACVHNDRPHLPSLLFAKKSLMCSHLDPVTTSNWVLAWLLSLTVLKVAQWKYIFIVYFIFWVDVSQEYFLLPDLCRGQTEQDLWGLLIIKLAYYNIIAGIIFCME